MSNNKQSMKLYTEEEIMNYLINHKSTITRYDLQNIPHIELPSDEEIEEYSLKWFMTANKHEIIFDLGWMKIFKAGAKMVIDKIQGGNNES